jgi:putative cell wall-binding protein/subtilisin family serine protease
VTHHPRRRTVRLSALASTAALVVPLAMLPTAAAQDGESEDPTLAGETRGYIVQLEQPSLATYDGGVRGIPGTRPDAGEKLDTTAAPAERYESYLVAEQDAVLESVGLSEDDVSLRYSTVFNGFAVELDGAQVAALRKAPGVLNVWEDEVRTTDTVSTPDYLGMTGADGVWQTRFGGQDDAGAGMVVGVVDSGIWPESPSFAAMDGASVPDTWQGVCQAGTEEPVTCNNKLIGARYYPHPDILSFEFLSPRDYDGHGSHTAGTAAGNAGVEMSVNDIDLGVGSGMAPAAHVAAYKAMWANGEGSATGFTSALVAAVDDAVADGVDVINYSVSGSTAFVVSPDQIAFLDAAAAGVFVATSAGNTGETVGAGSVAHNSPWTTTVAASTHDRNVNKTLTLGDDTVLDGVGVGPGVGPADLVYAGDIPAPGASARQARECHLDINPSAPGDQLAIDAGGAEGKVVVCDRGSTARTDKSAAVAQAGGVGMVHANVLPVESLTADFHSVPTIHVSSAVGEVVRDYVASADGPTAEISGPLGGAVIAPEMAGFSSYGPALAGSGDLLKPDLTAPGVDVVAAVSPADGGELFNSLSGTSMSTPHVAGLAALMLQDNPGWGPMAVKSAMMTTAGTDNSAGEPIRRAGAEATPLDYGSGEVAPGRAYEPGLVYDSSLADWEAYACALGQYQLVGGPCPDTATDPSDLNYPSISVGALTGSQSVTRTVTNVADTEQTYTATVEDPPGVEVRVVPDELTLAPGASETFTVHLDVVDAPVDAYAFGALTWTAGDTSVRSPVAVRPTGVSAEDELRVVGVDGVLPYEVVPGFTGTLETDVDGLVASTVQSPTVSPLPDDGEVRLDAVVALSVPPGTTTLRFATFATEVEAQDVDLYLFDPGLANVDLSAEEGSDEELTVHDPAPGTWRVGIDLFSGESDVAVPVHGFRLADTDAGNLDVNPGEADVTVGVPTELTAQWSGLTSERRYLGAVGYSAGTQDLGRTLVSVDTTAPTVDRLGGSNRYETAALIAAEYPDGVDTVYVASGTSFADALSAAAPAAAGRVPSTLPAADGSPAPVLLTRPASLPAATVAALDALEPSRIVLLGGELAVGEGVETALEAWGEVVRVGGSNRYGTSALMALLYPAGVDRVYVASGADASFPDALAGGALAGHLDAPVLLTRPDRVLGSTQAALTYLDADEVVVIGGESAVSEDVFTALGADERLSGDNRYLTAVAVSEQFPADAPATYVASGADWPDALSGSALAGHRGGPMTLTRPQALPAAVLAELDRLSPGDVAVLGGLTAVGLGVETRLNLGYQDWVD